jgi:hypothetical protein
MTINSSAAQTNNGAISFVLSSADDVCGDLTTSAGEAGTTNLAILVEFTSATGASQPVGSGSYEVGSGSGMVASGEFEQFDDNCVAANTIAAPLTGGTVVLTAVDNTTAAISGTLDLDLGSDHLSGSFSADPCGTFSGLRCPIVQQ